MRTLRLAVATLAVVVIAYWNAVVARRQQSGVGGRRARERTGTGPVQHRHVGGDPSDAAVVEHERNWYDYLRGYHVGDGDGYLPEHRPLREGLLTWWETSCMRGYTRGNDVYLFRTRRGSSGSTRPATRRRSAGRSNRSGPGDGLTADWMTGRLPPST